MFWIFVMLGVVFVYYMVVCKDTVEKIDESS